MKETIETKWMGKMAFQWEVGGHNLIIDAKENVGGEGRGPQPKIFMLASLGGCTAMDVISILQKMRVTDDIEDFNVQVGGDLTEELVLGWIKNQVSGSTPANYMNHINQQIQRQIDHTKYVNMDVQERDLPWSPISGSSVTPEPEIAPLTPQ